MCLSNSSFFDKLHSLNGNCTGSNSSGNFTVVKLNHPVTSFIYITIATLCVVFSLLTHYRYNSVTVLNLTVRNHVISNYSWIAYFTVLSLRSAVGSVIYGYTSARDAKHPTRLTVYFIADGALKSLEVLCLSWALYHQRMHRSAGFLQQEINSLNAEEFSSSGSERTSVTSAANERIKKSRVGALFVGQFILAMLFMMLLEELYETGYFTGKSQGKSEVSKLEPQRFYWIYMGFFWTQCITTVVLAAFIAANENEDGPTFMVKLLVVVGVILTLPGDIPSYIWADCMGCTWCKPKWYLTAYDFALFFSIPSVIIFFTVLKTEFLRLDQEVQYSVIGGEVDSLFSVHSQTIAES